MGSIKEPSRLEKLSDFQLLKDKVYGAIRKSIIDLSLPPHEQLVEQRLAADLGVSKSPIREALMRLEREGLVYTLPFKGSFVAGITPKDIHEIFQLREALEVFCIKHACEHFSAGQVQGAQKIVSSGAAALEKEDFRRCYVSNVQIHDFLIAQSDNERILQTYKTLTAHLDRYRKIASRIFGRVAKSHKEHLSIIKALERKNGAEAEELMRRHLRSLMDDFIHSQELQLFGRQGGSRSTSEP